MNNRVKYIIVTVILIAIAFAAVWYFIPLEDNPDLFVKYFEPYEDVIVNHSADDSDLLTLGMGAYGEQDYSVAMFLLRRFLNEVDEISPENKTAATFYLAVSNLGAGNIHTAKRQLEVIAIDKNNPFWQTASWYVALVNIKTGNIKNAKGQLIKIQRTTNHHYNKQAQELLEALSEAYAN